MKWIDIKSQIPEAGFIVFIGSCVSSFPKIGIALPDRKYVLIDEIGYDVSFSDIRYFIQLPEPPGLIHEMD